MPSPYENFPQDLAGIKALEKELDLAIQKAEKNGETGTAEQLVSQTKKKLDQIESQLAPGEIKTNFQNPETQETKEISINFEQELQFFTEFYQKQLQVQIDPETVKDIWRQNHREIKAEMEKYGYDQIIILPDNLPNPEMLNQKLIETMPNTNATWQSSNFQAGGSFQGSKTAESQNYRIILVHSDQDIYQNPQANPFLKATLGENIMQLSGLDEAEVSGRISANQEMPVNFEYQGDQVQGEGLSLQTYQIMQRVFFEKTGKHLDESSWTWLLKTGSGSRVVGSGWDPVDRQLRVRAADPVIASDNLGLRLSRSFKS